MQIPVLFCFVFFSSFSKIPGSVLTSKNTSPYPNAFHYFVFIHVTIKPYNSSTSNNNTFREKKKKKAGNNTCYANLNKTP